MKKRIIGFTIITTLIIGGVAWNSKILDNHLLLNKAEEVSESDNNEEKTLKVIDEQNEVLKVKDNKDNTKVNQDKFKVNKIKYIKKNINDIHVPILMYHSISDENPQNKLLVPVKQFEEQMKWLSENGFTPMSMDDILQSFETGNVPEKPIAITFDDGYMDNYKNAYPIMKKYNIKGTFFVITDGIDGGYYMSSDMLKEMLAYGMQIENHTSNHLELDKLSKEDQVLSIKTAQKTLKDKIGVDSKYLCYPVGKHNDTTLEVAREAGIKLAVTTKRGKAGKDDGCLTLDRVRVSPMDINTFMSML